MITILDLVDLYHYRINSSIGCQVNIHPMKIIKFSFLILLPTFMVTPVMNLFKKIWCNPGMMKWAFADLDLIRPTIYLEN